MQQKNSTKQYRSRTRNQRKRDITQDICMVCAMLVLWAMVCTVFVRALHHPAERPVSGYAYMETIGGDFYGVAQN